MTIDVALLGGSSAFTPLLAIALADRAAELPPLTVRLLGRSSERSDAVARFCNLVTNARGVEHEYVSTTSVDDAVRGASLALNQVRVGGSAGRVRDESFPLEFNLPGDETIGPGGLASAIRGTPVVEALARRTAALSPGAWFCNLTNPMGILVRGLQRVEGVKTFGLCELPGDTLARALRTIGVAPNDVESDYLGLNHQGWFVRIERDGIDLLPRIFDALEASDERRFFKVDVAIMREIGALPLHYLHLYYHTQRAVDRAVAAKRRRGEELAQLSNQLYQHYAATDDATLPAALFEREMPWIADAIVPCIVALLGGADADLFVSRPNSPEMDGGNIDGLPADAIVERRCRVSASGIEAQPYPPNFTDNPRIRPLLDLLRRVAESERLATNAALQPNDDNILASLRAHPLGVGGTTGRELADAVRQSAAIGA